LTVSLLFFAWGEPWFVLVMMASILFNWLCGLWVGMSKRKSSPLWPAILLTCVGNLGLLFVYKYLSFAIGILNRAFSWELYDPKLLLPIGISFFTFQAMSYVLDVARDAGEMQKNPLHVALYVALFPQLIAGPIVRYQTVADEIQQRRENLAEFCQGMERFVYGLAKKVIFANTLGLVADRAFGQNPAWLSPTFAWCGIIAYSLQIYYDFSGYSDMGIGLGLMFGFHFEENFNFPYISTSVSEFWRRWHISLGTWFRDYVYFPLGGSRVSSQWRLVGNLAVVWFLTGLWHGADITFVLWGLYFLAFLIIEKLSGIDDRNQQGHPVARRFYTLLVVILGWVLFRAESFTQGVAYYRALLGLNGTPLVDEIALYYLRENGVIFCGAILLCCPWGKRVAAWLQQRSLGVKWLEPAVLTGVFLLAISCLVKDTYNPFIYFNF
ncbi:MAG: MBOAT family protein, partial [Symbiobacteriaceae bacterium]|nr:MBOAT family protein [Symbiobacteriaceae bacterium]